jgi:hypothetical protein
MGAVASAMRQRSVSHPRSSNRTCRSPASGSPTGFTVRHTGSNPNRTRLRGDPFGARVAASTRFRAFGAHGQLLTSQKVRGSSLFGETIVRDRLNALVSRRSNSLVLVDGSRLGRAEALPAGKFSECLPVCILDRPSALREQTLFCKRLGSSHRLQ